MLTLVLVSMLTLNPDEILARAVAKMEMCGYEKQEKQVLNDAHNPVSPQPNKAANKDDPDPIKNISLPIMFRQGRYRLESAGQAILEQKEVTIINFFPLPEKSMLKPNKAEDWRFARAMNFLSGSVYIDAENGGIVRVETRIAEEVPYDKWFMTLFKIHELEFTFEQQLQGERWVPRLLQLEWRGRSKAGIRSMHERYNITFSCN